MKTLTFSQVMEQLRQNYKAYILEHRHDLSSMAALHYDALKYGVGPISNEYNASGPSTGKYDISGKPLPTSDNPS